MREAVPPTPARPRQEKPPPRRSPVRQAPEVVAVRPARRGDLDRVIAIDAAVTGLPKRSYWLSIYRRYSGAGRVGRYFLVADSGGEVRGFIIGDVRDWEFGSPPCGWVFAIDVEPRFRVAGIGTRLLTAICANFRRAGVFKVRTILAHDNTLILSFFRSQGMMAAPFIPLEMDLEV
ncbi:MAG: GNAT family N-acetyltransferase [Betaproteobacteria bacterium]|nr:GNAT family N-acetyltransferase [Betaproteobacteria bacterium]MDE2358139.1 GNAT family N-acetyltransferase [Betaproteobacteria bacterium]